VALSTAFEEILKDMSSAKEAAQFLFPVNAKQVPDYHKFVSQPMDLQTMKEKNRTREYQSREDLLRDALLLVENSKLYNGPQHPLTRDAHALMEVCVQRIKEREQLLMDLEKSINPLLDEDSRNALSFVLDNILQTKIKVLPESYPFLKPVNKMKVKDYFSVIQQPMDLETMEKKIKGERTIWNMNCSRTPRNLICPRSSLSLFHPLMWFYGFIVRCSLFVGCCIATTSH
jgi:transcription initiation factor TFIID subunit 1